MKCNIIGISQGSALFDEMKAIVRDINTLFYRNFARQPHNGIKHKNEKGLKQIYLLRQEKRNIVYSHHALINSWKTGISFTATLASNEDPNEMPHYVAFLQGLHFSLSQIDLQRHLFFFLKL